MYCLDAKIFGLLETKTLFKFITAFKCTSEHLAKLPTAKRQPTSTKSSPEVERKPDVKVKEEDAVSVQSLESVSSGSAETIVLCSQDYLPPIQVVKVDSSRQSPIVISSDEELEQSMITLENSLEK